jgi:4-amino-4-deoxy-L-arabinose transferase-like glycosyltransferase
MLAAAMLASCMVLMVETHIAKTDAALFATVTAAMGLFGRPISGPAVHGRQAAAFWMVIGIGILLKGPIAPMVVAAGRGDAGLLRPRRALAHAPCCARPVLGIPLMLLVVLPWMIAIGIATEGRFFAQAIGGDMLAKVGAGDEKHIGARRATTSSPS